MKVQEIVRLLQLVRANNIEVSPDSLWVRCSCPLAHITHESGTDKRPSFGIKVNNNGPSNVNCFTCGSGTLSSFIHRATWTVGISPKVHEFYLLHENFGQESDHAISDSDLPFDDPFLKEKPPLQRPIPVPDYVLKNYPLLEESTDKESQRIKDWVLSRGIELEVAYKFGLRMDYDRRGVVFPIIDTDGLTYLLHYRSRRDKIFYYINPLHAGYPEELWGRQDFWFGIQFYDPKKPAILVESETDVLRLYSMGVENVLASCGSVGDYKLDRVNSESTILGFDSDLGGARYCMKSIQNLHSRSRLYRLKWSIVGRKDAGALGSKYEYDMVWRHRESVWLEGTELHMFPVVNYAPKPYNDPFNRGMKGGPEEGPEALPQSNKLETT